MRSLIVANADVIFVNQDVRTPSPPKVVGIPGRVTKSCMVVNETVASPALVHGRPQRGPPNSPLMPLKPGSRRASPRENKHERKQEGR